jgi:hypothetical protein
MKYTKITLISLILCLFIFSSISSIKSFKNSIDNIIENTEKDKSNSDINPLFLNLQENLKSGNKNENENENEISLSSNKPKNAKGGSKTGVRKAVNNVYLHTVNFYVGLLNRLNDPRTPRDLAREIVRNCPKLNIFDTIRENLINCLTLQRKLDNRNRNVIKDFQAGCMKKILTDIRTSCTVLQKSNADKAYTSALKLLNNFNQKSQKKLRHIGSKFIRRVSFYLGVTEALVDERLKIMNKFEVKRIKIEEKKKKARKGKKKFFLEISSNLMNERKKGKKTVRNNLGIQLPSNNPYDVNFLKETNLNSERVLLLRQFVVKIINYVNISF